MGFRKALYDVEEKGLDPSTPHRNLGSDGRLTPALSNPSSPVVSEVNENKTVLVTHVSNHITSTETTKEQLKEVLTSDLNHDSSKSSNNSNELPNALQELSGGKEPSVKSRKTSTTNNGGRKSSAKITKVKETQPKSTRRKDSDREAT